MRQKRLIVAFDFDGTITQKDSLIEFIKFVRGESALFWGILRFSPLLFAFKLKCYPNWKIKQKLFSYFFKGVSAEKFSEWGREFVGKVSGMVRAQALESIEGYLQEGATIYIVTASIENWIAPWAHSVGEINVLSTKIEINEDGYLSGKFMTKNCYGPEKVKRLLEMEPDRDSYILYAYGDSKGDKELISFADKGWYNKFK